MLNTLYDDFIRQFGNLNDRKNIDLFRMDAGNREILSLERYIDGRAVKADIFDHPVSYNINEITHTDDVHEALTASLNKYGNVDMAYMESLTDKSQSDLLEELRGRIFYNPLSKNYEIADRFISGNVMAKAEHIEEYLQSHPDNGEARISSKPCGSRCPRPYLSRIWISISASVGYRRECTAVTPHGCSTRTCPSVIPPATTSTASRPT